MSEQQIKLNYIYMIQQKQCGGKNGCGEMLPLENFAMQKTGKYGRTSNCKQCKGVYVKEYYKENPDKYTEKKALCKAWVSANPGYITPSMQAGYDLGFVVYLIPNHNGEGDDYVGQTSNVYCRTNYHRNGHKVKGILPKLNTDKIKILHYCDMREEALELEASYHARGFAGLCSGDWISN